MRKKAEQLGYDVIQATQAHAEGQLLQFLLHRNKANPGLYTHIMGIGCSRCFCAECDTVLNLFLGESYYEVAASVKATKKNENKDGPATVHFSFASRLTNFGTPPSCYTQVVEQEIQYKVVQGLEVVDTATYGKYYIPRTLKEEINLLLDQKVRFSNERFHAKEEREQGRKRINLLDDLLPHFTRSI
jgi:hypothetical protein